MLHQPPEVMEEIILSQIAVHSSRQLRQRDQQHNSEKLEVFPIQP
jgi:hypothetical protein